MPLLGRVDVLIIGAGPGGLMCANALALAGVDVRIIDIRPAKVEAGQADGVHPRSIEILQSYGLAERVIREGNHVHMVTFYSPGRNGGIELAGRKPAVNEPTPFPFGITLQQAAIEAIFLDSLKERGIEVERPSRPSHLEILEEVDELSTPSYYPVKVTVEHLDEISDEIKTEIIYAKFVIGADGAHSWVRKTLGIEMEGEQTDYIWGVVDMLQPETDFPDIRNIAAIQSEKGSCILIPREADMSRLYTQLSDRDLVNPSTGRIDKDKTSPGKILSIAREIFQPYEIADPKVIEWWTVYIIGQRVATNYSVKDRVFITGDACHTHSPKAGQGMNASMNDSHNLAWKLVHVLRGWSSPSLLKTYEQERREFARDLIDFDKKYAALFSEKPTTMENGGDVPPNVLSQMLRTYDGFISGLGIQYSPSAIIDPKHQKYAKSLVIGRRMLPQILVRAADMHPVDIHDLLPADVRFKLLLFVGKLTSTRITELNLLAEDLSKPSSFLYKYSSDGNISTVFEIVTLVAGKKGEINHLHIPAFFRPHWTKVLLDDTDVTESQGGHAYESFGIDPEQITLVVVRPDGYVGTITPLAAAADHLENYFGSFMVPRDYPGSQFN